MKATNKYRTLIWVIVILVATNLSTIGSLYYHRMSEIKSSELGKNVQTNIPGEQRTRFFKDELNLDADQINQFRDINRTFNRTAKGIEMNLAQLREALITELGTQTPDSARLNQMAAEVGNNHRELKKVTTSFYLEMKKICTSEQQSKLHEIFQSMLNKDNQINLPRSGFQGGRWRNQ